MRASRRAGIFVGGILSALLRIGSAYRFAAIALSIVLLIAHASPRWIIALHRFIEVSLGIPVALMVTLVWPLPARVRLIFTARRVVH